MEQKTRIRINLNSREVEWEGSETFIAKYDAVISDFMSLMKEPNEIPLVQSSPTVNKNINRNINTTSPNQATSIPESFGEFYTSFPRSIKVVDKILIAAYFVQQKSTDGLFTIKEAADLLNEQNVLITNANAFIKSLLKTGKLFKNSGKYKVSENGIEIVKQLNTQTA